MKKLLLIGMFLLCAGFVLGITAGDSDADGILDSAEAAAVSCSMNCPTGYHCEIPKGTVIYKTENKYKGGDLNSRIAADAICASQKPAGLNFINVHAVVSFKELSNTRSDFILYMPNRFGYDPFLPLYWYNRNTNNLVLFAGNWKDATTGVISKSNYAGTGDNEMYWTGSSSDGKYFWDVSGNRTCNGWKTNSITMLGQVGNPLSINTGWFSYNQSNCSQQLNKILCAAESTAGASAGSCVSDCTPTKTLCQPGDCGLHSNGCGGKILCSSLCSLGQRCRSAFNDPFAFNLKCTSCLSCSAGQNLNAYNGESATFGGCRNSNWNCKNYDGDCSGWFFGGFVDSSPGLCKGAPGGATCESSGTGGVRTAPFDIDAYANTLKPAGCTDDLGNYGKCRSYHFINDNAELFMPPYNYTSNPEKFSSCSCVLKGKCDVGSCPPAINLKCAPNRPTDYWVGCDYGCCTGKTSFTGRKCPSYMNPGADPEYNDNP